MSDYQRIFDSFDSTKAHNCNNDNNNNNNDNNNNHNHNNTTQVYDGQFHYNNFYSPLNGGRIEFNYSASNLYQLKWLLKPSQTKKINLNELIIRYNDINITPKKIESTPHLLARGNFASPLENNNSNNNDDKSDDHISRVKIDKDANLIMSIPERNWTRVFVGDYCRDDNQLSACNTHNDSRYVKRDYSLLSLHPAEDQDGYYKHITALRPTPINACFLTYDALYQNHNVLNPFMTHNLLSLPDIPTV